MQKFARGLGGRRHSSKEMGWQPCVAEATVDTSPERLLYGSKYSANQSRLSLMTLHEVVPLL